MLKDSSEDKRYAYLQPDSTSIKVGAEPSELTEQPDLQTNAGDMAFMSFLALFYSTASGSAFTTHM